jgi:hypothetical protein
MTAGEAQVEHLPCQSIGAASGGRIGLYTQKGCSDEPASAYASPSAFVKKLASGHVCAYHCMESRLYEGLRSTQEPL